MPPEIRSHISVTQHQNIICTEVSPSHSDWPTVSKEPSEFSSDRTRMDASEYSDVNIIQSVELHQTNSSVGSEENTPKERCQDFLLQGDEFDDEDQTNIIHSVMEDDQSILVCLPSCPVTASSDTLTSDQPPFNMNPSEEFTCRPTCDVNIGTELLLSTSTFTQTEDPETADKHVITEVHMADLDYLAEEFIKLKTTHELKEQKEKRTRRECGCTERAQKAELSLLALQYNICRHHCWRLYYTSAEGNQLSSVNKDPPANIVNVLEKLDSDYNEMKREILAGVALEQLKPLSVDSRKIITGSSYIPAQITADVLGNVCSWTSEEPQQLHTAAELNRSPDSEGRNSSQVVETEEKHEKIIRTRRAAALILQDRSYLQNNKQEGKQTAAVREELNRSDLWFDAEEDLELPEAGQNRAEDPADESVTEEAEGSVLYVSNLPREVTKEYQASEVRLSALKDDQRVAIVMVSGTQSAKAAVKELNGHRMKGHTLHLEHISRDVGVSRSQNAAGASGQKSFQDATKHQTTENSSSRKTERKNLFSLQPPLGCSISIRNRKVVFVSPTAKGTCVPQHYGTMGSFDTLMSELLQHHPEVGRQKIMDALIELRAKDPGILTGLPLQTIREMTSELLNRPDAAPQL